MRIIIVLLIGFIIGIVAAWLGSYVECVEDGLGWTSCTAYVFGIPSPEKSNDDGVQP